MAHILHIDSSPRGNRSVSRTLAAEFVDTWKASHSTGKVTYRDLGHQPVPHVDEAWIAGAFAPPETHTPEQSQAIQVSDMLVNEFLAAERYVLGVPMYNLNIPSTLKAYIDQIVRVGLTFSVGPNGYEGLVHGKKMLVITARGGAYPQNSPADMQEPYLRLIFGFIGITDITFIHADSLNLGDEARAKAVADAQGAIKEALVHW